MATIRTPAAERGTETAPGLRLRSLVDGVERADSWATDCEPSAAARCGGRRRRTPMMSMRTQPASAPTARWLCQGAGLMLWFNLKTLSGS